jgi:hypothetical protein
VSALRGLPNTHIASDLSLAGLLTLGGRDEQTGDPYTDGSGLLREVGDFGTILVPELSTLLAESRREESKVFGALREIITDGCYSRRLNGRLLAWQGKVKFICSVTEAVDELGMGALGERFLCCRVPAMDEEDDLKAGAMALSEERGSVDELRELVTQFVRGLDVPGRTPGLLDDDRDKLSLLGVFVTRCRSTVMWDKGHADAVVDIPQPERSARLLRGCAQLLRALRVIGCDEAESWRVVRHVGLGSIRTRKRRVLAELMRASLPMIPGHVAARARLPETGVRRDLAEMDAFGIVDLVGERPSTWIISEKYRSMWADLVELSGAIDLASLRPEEPSSAALALVERAFAGSEGLPTS